jgi:hypothetical protein
MILEYILCGSKNKLNEFMSSELSNNLINNVNEKLIPENTKISELKRLRTKLIKLKNGFYSVNSNIAIDLLKIEFEINN